MCVVVYICGHIILRVESIVVYIDVLAHWIIIIVHQVENHNVNTLPTFHGIMVTAAFMQGKNEEKRKNKNEFKYRETEG